MRLTSGFAGGWDLDDGHQAAQFGRLLAAASALLVVLTIGVLPAAPGRPLAAGVVVLVAAAVLGVSLRLPWHSLPRATQLLHTGGILAPPFIVALLTDGVSPAYAALYVLVFVHVGLTQRRRMLLWVLPVAVACWLVIQEGIDVQRVVRLAIAVGVWLVVGTLLAQRTGHERETTSSLRRRSLTDALTGLPNRFALEAAMTSLTAGDAVAVLDLDHFKQLNDSRGHPAGDEVLRAFAEALRGCVRSNDVAARFGGEEFVLVLRGAGALGAADVMDRLRRRWRSMSQPVSFSAGVALAGAPGGAKSGADVLREADAALYRAKFEGRDGWRLAGTP